MKIGILTGGGDCPGLNSVIYGVLLQAYEGGHEVVGIEKGWKGFMENIQVPLKISEHDDLHTIGGTILYTSRFNPYKDAKKYKNKKERDKFKKEVAEKMAKQFDKLKIDALIAIGGDDTLGVANAMHQYAKANVVGVPKTIDNDLSNTDYTFGFWSAVQLASNTMDNVTTTARSHQRIFVVEVMGRDAGWLTLMSGISTGADIILLPETPFDLEKDVIEVLKNRVQSGYKYHIIACSEGAYPNDRSLNHDFKTISKETIDNLPKDVFGNPLLAKLNMAKRLVDELKLRDDLKEIFEKNDAEYECRDVILGHTMRAGTPNAYDRVLGLRFGMHAMDLVDNGDFGNMVSLRSGEIEAVPLTKGSKKKLVDPNSDLVRLKDLIINVRYKSREPTME